VSRIRVLIAEDHQVVGDALATMLSFDDSIVIVDTVTGGADAVATYEERRPDLVLMDVGLEGLNGIEATRRIRERHPAARVLMLTMHDDDETVTAALAAGALGYLPKNVDRDALMTAVRTVAAGDGYIHPRVTTGFLERVRPAAT
jgi:two-component system, NarL family, response regulator DegU